MATGTPPPRPAPLGSRLWDKFVRNRATKAIIGTVLVVGGIIVGNMHADTTVNWKAAWSSGSSPDKRNTVNQKRLAELGVPLAQSDPQGFDPGAQYPDDGQGRVGPGHRDFLLKVGEDNRAREAAGAPPVSIPELFDAEQGPFRGEQNSGPALVMLNEGVIVAPSPSNTVAYTGTAMYWAGGSANSILDIATKIHQQVQSTTNGVLDSSPQAPNHLGYQMWPNRPIDSDGKAAAVGHNSDTRPVGDTGRLATHIQLDDGTLVPNPAVDYIEVDGKLRAVVGHLLMLEPGDQAASSNGRDAVTVHTLHELPIVNMLDDGLIYDDHDQLQVPSKGLRVITEWKTQRHEPRNIRIFGGSNKLTIRTALEYARSNWDKHPARLRNDEMTTNAASGGTCTARVAATAVMLKDPSKWGVCQSWLDTDPNRSAGSRYVMNFNENLMTVTDARQGQQPGTPGGVGFTNAVERNDEGLR